MSINRYILYKLWLGYNDFQTRTIKHLELSRTTSALLSFDPLTDEMWRLIASSLSSGQKDERMLFTDRLPSKFIKLSYG